MINGLGMSLRRRLHISEVHPLLFSIQRRISLHSGLGDLPLALPLTSAARVFHDTYFENHSKVITSWYELLLER